MPRYLLKGLSIAFLILAVLVGVGIATGVLASAKLHNTVNVAQERGYQEGYSKGYQEGLNKGNEAGYQEGSKLGYLAAGGTISQVDEKGYYFLYNPTYAELMSALNESQLYSAQEILDYAKANGIRAAYVRVPIARPASEGRIYLYQLVAFETVDKGFIIVEPRSHRPVKVEAGESYSQLNGFPVSPFDDTITKVTVVW
ncbi:MAG: hypothetical protein HYX80_04470 [Chloroflexi bacterium]|nr:hypothetical protein [Chloroflexota bacterium]